VFPSCGQGLPNIGMASDMSMCNNPSYVQLNSTQQLVSCFGGLINNVGISPPNVGVRRNLSTTTTHVPLPEAFIDSSCFTVCFPFVYAIVVLLLLLFCNDCSCSV